MKRKYLLITLITMLTVLLTTGIGILTSYVSNFFSLTFKPFALPLLGIVALMVSVLTAWLYHLQREPEQHILTPGSQNRQRMLDKVRAFWITGVLEQSLHGAALIVLGLHEQHNALANPWRLVLQRPNHSAHALPPGTHITQVYDDAVGELLILGEPGSGKTTLLLELARDLLDRAQKDITHPIPVVFNLSSWAVKRQPIAKWLIEEMNTKYQVPYKLGQSWIEADHVLPLLDGLDEVATEYRAECVSAINSYRREHMVSIVVCSRREEYLSQTARVLLHNAVVVQALTLEQIDDYLSSVGRHLASVRVALRADPALQELVSTPLMLSVLTLAYYGKSIEDLLAMDPQTQRKQIFATYVQHMLQRREMKTNYTYQQMMHWLTWLARQMAQHSQTEFYIERMQLDWLPKSSSHLYGGITSGLIYGLLVGPSVGVGVYFGPVYGLVAGLAAGLVFGFLGKLDMEIQSKEVKTSPWITVGRKLINLLDKRLIFGFLAGIAGGLIVMVYNGSRFGLPTAVRTGVANGLIAGLAFGLLGKLHAEIQPTESLTWSWMAMKRNLIKFLGIALAVGLVVGLTGALVGMLIDRWVMELAFGLVTALIAVLLLGLLYGLMGGVSNEMLDERNFVTPNQGIRQSIRNSLFIGIITMLTVGLLDGLLLGSFNGLLYGEAFGIAFGLHHGVRIGLFFGLAVGLRYGGVACIQHVVLRQFLWRDGSIPWNYPRFLDYATECILLRKVGGGYIFIHRLLLDYFASLDISG